MFTNMVSLFRKKRCVFCGPCLLFDRDNYSQFSKDGFNDRKNAESRVSQHENSTKHKSNLITLKERANTLGTINVSLTKQLDEHINYWENVLRRVVATVKALSSRGLPLRGHNEKFGSTQNGNYLMAMELISEFDPFLAEHIGKFGQCGSGHTNYLSSTIYEEIIQLMADKIRQKIIDEIKTVKYYSIIVDSSPDISHVDQLSFVIRYVQENGVPIERFLQFLPNTGHKAIELFDSVTKLLNSYEIKIENCRGQSYDNARNMSGIYSGLQARIKELNPLIEYVPCSAHSLNLVGSCAADSCDDTLTYFSLLQTVYNFFSSSTNRWEILKTQLKNNPESKTVKILSNTRWPSRDDACKSLNSSWNEIRNALISITNNLTEKATTINEARSILNKLDSLETAFMTVLWSCLLDRLNKASKQLQSVNIDVSVIVDIYDSLIEYTKSLRNPIIFNEYENKAKLLSVVKEYKKSRNRVRKSFHDETRNQEQELEGSDKFRVKTYTVYTVILNYLTNELEDRRAAYFLFNSRFSFLGKLTEYSVDEIMEFAKNLQNNYKEDLEEDFPNECIHLQAHLKNKDKMSILQLCKWLKEYGFYEMYPNIDIAIRIFVCTPAANCSTERSFSCLKRIKTYLRSQIKQERLNSMAILTIESSLLVSLPYEDIIKSFANKTARRQLLKLK
uniref:Zinc finger MYM-type protein 1 n=1 Tax=Schizaphis graminum TaxID=13262 RepID=A0A2S2NB80_SCHGA